MFCSANGRMSRTTWRQRREFNFQTTQANRSTDLLQSVVDDVRRVVGDHRRGNEDFVEVVMFGPDRLEDRLFRGTDAAEQAQTHTHTETQEDDKNSPRCPRSRSGYWNLIGGQGRGDLCVPYPIFILLVLSIWVNASC